MAALVAGTHQTAERVRPPPVPWTVSGEAGAPGAPVPSHAGLVCSPGGVTCSRVQCLGENVTRTRARRIECAPRHLVRRRTAATRSW